MPTSRTRTSSRSAVSSRGAAGRCSSERTGRSRPRRPTSFRNRWVNEFRMQYAPQDQEINSLDPLCGGPCLAEDQGGPTLEITGVASVGRQRFTPNPRRNRRLQFAETISFLAGSHHLKAGLGFSHIEATRGALPLHFGGRYIFSAVPALGITSGLQAFSAQPAVGLRPGLWQLGLRLSGGRLLGVRSGRVEARPVRAEAGRCATTACPSATCRSTTSRMSAARGCSFRSRRTTTTSRRAWRRRTT